MLSFGYGTENLDQNPGFREESQQKNKLFTVYKAKKYKELRFTRQQFTVYKTTVNSTTVNNKKYSKSERKMVTVNSKL